MPRLLNIVVPTVLLVATHALYLRHDTIVVTAQLADGGELVPKWIVFNIPGQYSKLLSNLNIVITDDVPFRNGYALPSNMDIASVISELATQKFFEDNETNNGFKLENTVAVGPNTVIFTFQRSLQVVEE